VILTWCAAVGVQEAQEVGCITISGLEMFVGQAAQQFELFTGKPAPVELMRRATIESLAPKLGLLTSSH
jgi:shikimate 5-dehydrogenase